MTRKHTNERGYIRARATARPNADWADKVCAKRVCLWHEERSS